MITLNEYYGQLARREGEKNLRLASAWSRKDVKAIVRCLRTGFESCGIRQRPFKIKPGITGPALGNRVAEYFVVTLDPVLASFQIRACKGAGYPDRRLERVSTKRAYPLELKATTAFAADCDHRMVLTSSSEKLRKQFVPPINHLLLTILYRRQGSRIWVRDYRLDFLEPWSSVCVRLEASVSQRLLAIGKHPSAWCMQRP